MVRAKVVNHNISAALNTNAAKSPEIRAIPDYYPQEKC